MEPIDAHDAAELAAHKAKSAVLASDLAAELRQKELVEQTAAKTKEALLEGLREVFGEGDEKDPEQMKVLVRRIPILCTNIENMHADIADIKDGNKWVIRLVVGGVVLALLKLVLIP